MSDERCDFVGGPCPAPKRCVYPRCQIEYSGSPLYNALRQMVCQFPTQEVKDPVKKATPKKDDIDDSFFG